MRWFKSWFPEYESKWVGTDLYRIIREPKGFFSIEQKFQDLNSDYHLWSEWRVIETNIETISDARKIQEEKENTHRRVVK